jgi:hypothetical protein
VAKLEERAGPEARKLFEQLIEQVEELRDGGDGGRAEDGG